MNATHRFDRLLSAYLDGELSPAEMAEVRVHLVECDACRTELEALRAVKAVLGGLRAVEPPRGYEAALLEALSRSPRRPWWAWPRPAMAVAAAMLGLALVVAPVVRDHRDRLRAAEVSPDLFVRTAVQAAAADPFMDRAYIGLITSDTNLRLLGEDPRGGTR